MTFIKYCSIVSLVVMIALTGSLSTQSNVEAQDFVPRISLISAPDVDTCTQFDFLLPIDVDFDGQPRSYSDEMRVDGVGLVRSFKETFTGPLTGPEFYGFYPADAYSVPAHTTIRIVIYTYFDAAATHKSWQSEMHFDCTDGTISYFYDGPPVSSQPAPQVGMISISTAQEQPVYDAAGGSIVRNRDRSELRLPQDFDGNGSDTYLVMGSAEIDGQTWYEIFIGNGASMVWVPANNVTGIE